MPAVFSHFADLLSKRPHCYIGLDLKPAKWALKISIILVPQVTKLRGLWGVVQGSLRSSLVVLYSKGVSFSSV